MKRALIAVLFILSAAAIAPAQQTTHSVTLTWTDTLNPAGTTYNVYRATGLCRGTPAFAKIATALTAKTYADTTVIPGNYCYAATATFNGAESVQSNTVNPSVPAFAPSALGFTEQ
jgi:hypothetical protein